MLLQEFANQLNLDDQTKRCAEDRLKEFKEKRKNQNEHVCYYYIGIACAVYVACQTQTLRKIDGSIEYGNGVTLTQIIRWLDESVDIESFFAELSEYLRCIKLEISLSEKVSNASLCFRIYKKFDQCLKEISIQKVEHTNYGNYFDVIDYEQQSSTPSFKDEQQPNLIQNQDNNNQKIDDGKDYLKTLKNLAWIMFLLIKSKLSQNDLENIDQRNNTILIIAHLSCVIIALPEGYTCENMHVTNQDNLLTPINRQKELTQIIKRITQIIAPKYDMESHEMGFIDEIEEYMQKCYTIVGKYKQVLAGKLGVTFEIEDNEEDMEYQSYIGLFEEGPIIKQNYRKFAQLYDKNEIGQLDEECFLRQKIVFTPKKRIPQNNNFNFIDSSDLLFEGKISKKIKLNNTAAFEQSPSLFQYTPVRQQQRTNIILGDKMQQTTPVSKVMQQFQWFKLLTQDNKLEVLNHYVTDWNEFDTKFQAGILQYFENTQNCTSTQQIVQIVYKFFLKVLDYMVQGELEKEPLQIPQLLKNDDFLFSLLAISIETQQHINNKEIKITQLLNACQINAIILWRIISNFATFHRAIPESITRHLFDLEKSLLLCHVWEDQDTYQYFLNLLRNKSNQQQSTNQRYFENVLLRRFQQHLGLRTIELQQVLEIKEVYLDQAWKIMGSIMANPPDIQELWLQRHMDQIIICTFYMIMKHAKQEPKFKIFKEVIFNKYQIKFNQTQNIFTNLVDYYNKYYLSNFKEYLTTTQQQQQQQFTSPHTTVPQAFLMASPLVRKTPLVMESPQQIQLNDRQFRNTLAQRILQSRSFEYKEEDKDENDKDDNIREFSQ